MRIAGGKRAEQIPARLRPIPCGPGGETSGYLKAVWQEICGSVFGRFSATLVSQTPLERRGSSCSAGCITNQPRRPISKAISKRSKIPARLPSGTQLRTSLRITRNPGRGLSHAPPPPHPGRVAPGSAVIPSGKPKNPLTVCIAAYLTCCCACLGGHEHQVTGTPWPAS